MPLEQEVVQWAATRPPWQQHLLCRIARGDILTDGDYEQVLESNLASGHIGDDQLAIKDLPIAVEGDDPVRLVSIADPKHVNALASAQSLTIALDGITIIYGDNGTGKSGYARLLKGIARARHQEEILSDVFRDTSLAEPSARITVRIGDREESLDGLMSSLPELQRMLFYDSECGSAYISAESDFPYRPSALFVMDRLIDACTAVGRLIDARLTKNNAARKTLPVVDDLVSDTGAGRFLTSLSSNPSAGRLDALIGSLDQSADTVESLREQEARLSAGDTTQERQRLNRNAGKLASLAAHLDKVQRALATDVISELKVQRDRVRTLDEATSLLARAFESEPLAGVGTSAWKELWEAARRFSETHAYPGDVFPVIGSSCRCVLCQQALNDEGQGRLGRFAEFVRNDTQQQLAEASRQLDTSRDQVANLSVQSEAVETNLLDLEASYPELVSETRSTLALADEARTVLVKALSESGDLPRVGFEGASLIVRLREASVQASADAQELADPEAAKQRLHIVTKRRMEIELLGAMKRQRSVIVEESKRLKSRTRLEGVKNSAGTGAITRKISELSAAKVTEVIRDRFTRETDRLQIERVTIAKTRAQRTALLYQPRLVGARQQVTLPQVFSEGEKTALGLAAFFTEAYLDVSKSALILDDPVSSLDHIRRGLVANRLVDLGQDRQIIVFTHDVSLVADIKREAIGKGVGVTDRSVAKSRAGDRKPGACSTKHPWKAKDVSERLGALRGELARIKRDFPGWEQDHYEKEIAFWAGNLSETWERIFSQEIVGPVLAEGGIEVRPAMVKVLARFSDEDNAEFQASYSRISQWTKRHDKSVVVNYVAPEVSVLESELALVNQWFRKIKTYKNQ